MTMKTAALLLSLLGLAASAFAGDKIELPPGWKTPMGPKGTALEAAKRIFPGATLDREDKLVLAGDKQLRMPGTSKDRAELPEGTTLSSPWYPLTVRSQGKTYTVLHWEGERQEHSDNGGWADGLAVVAVFAKDSIEPTDVAEVKQDRDTSLAGLVNLGDEDAFMVSSTHSNSAQGYALTDLFHLRDGRLRRIAAGIFTLSDNFGCAKSFDESLSWRTEPDGANPPQIIATVTLTHAPKEFTDGCKGRPQPRVEVFENRYRWDPARNQYRDAGGNLDRLYKWNERNV